MKTLNRKGSILIIAMLTISFLAALAIAVLNPVGTSEHVSDENYRFKRATMAADSAAERIKYIMCRDGAIDADGCSPCFIEADGVTINWQPITNLIDNNFIDEPGVTFPSLNEVGPDGLPKYRMDHPDPRFRPEIIGFGDSEARYIAYTTEDGSGNAVSYVSAEYEGEIRDMRISYHRWLASSMPHPSYFKAAYAANEWAGELFTFLLEDGTWTESIVITNTRTVDPDLTGGIDASGGSKGCINIQKDRTKGWLQFAIPDVPLTPGQIPQLKLYVQNVPGNGNVKVSLWGVEGDTVPDGFRDNSQVQSEGNPLGELWIDGSDVKKEFIRIDIDPDKFAEYAGQNMTVALTYDASDSNNESALHLKAKDDHEPKLIYTVEEEQTITHTGNGNDTIAGDIFIDGNAEIGEDSVEGMTQATGEVIGDGDGEEESGADDIPAPELGKDGDWYTGLQVSEDGLTSTNPDVITDTTDGEQDGIIAGIICTVDQTGENQPYMLDQAPEGETVYVLDGNIGTTCGSGDDTYDYWTDSTVVTVPDSYNNKAIYIPGDFWIDILNPVDIDFRGESGQPVNLTFVVEGNVYMTDGINNGNHPDAVEGGIVSVIALKREDGTGGDIYYGDPASSGVIDPINSFLYAENDFKWLADAHGRGEFEIYGNMTAGGQIDFTSRDNTDQFIPVDVEFNPAILDPELRASLPALPPDNGDDIIPGTPYAQGGTLYID